MKRLRIRHQTGFSYEGEVTASYNEARMLPANSDGQFVLHSQLEISPLSSQHGYVDYWGTRVSSFEILTPHRDLSLTATSLVEVREREHSATGISWEELPELAASQVQYIEQTRQTTLTQPPDDVVELARRIAAETSGPCEAAEAIARAVGESMEYMQGVTGVHSTAREAWAERKGVCQDITHVALGALRSLGIPARYVSGYLHPKPDAEVGETVTGESHAWIEWFCGDWHAWDPTNLIPIGDRHVLVGRGRDYKDVAPLRGVYAGPFRSDLFVRVEITRES
ncbi:transglutaminase family protein [Herbiconiux sp. L3-i23]|uniref:transglutaminase family protein n=1 Tax=Herbiconiux sp. L3-i23 TaxID=2905871 RepID=UPI0020636A98|nr:transglutaminase family protein [Herbiconiux sp. L3-i23]BDI21307.1 transglutaminase-like protein [Herbiconiux sp. L3-i23]